MISGARSNRQHLTGRCNRLWARVVASLIPGGLLALLAGCQSIPVVGQDTTPERPVIESVDADEVDYSAFRQRRQQAAEGSPENDFRVPGGFSDPTFPASIGNAAVISDPAMNQRLASVVGQLLEQWPSNAPEINIAVTDSSNPSPSVTPGATIVIPRGFLEMSRSLDELYFAVGHEMAHVLLD
ncbi:MAG TPA: M48 family metalloprotease, partial [Wenzhouxiangellaceae bacterium]|nr:M48 family metalloprotease [Wenzhouxiangellaceae bacterium]